MDALVAVLFAPGTAVRLTVLAVLCTACARLFPVSRKRRVLSACAWGLAAGAFLPGLDALARSALWIHALQSLLLHHWVPQMIARERGPIFDPKLIGARTALPTWVAAVAFGGASIAWMLPPMHGWVMREDFAYLAMSISMLISGIFWHTSVSRWRKHRSENDLAIQIIAFCPQWLLGGYLLVTGPVYLFDMGLCTASIDPVLARLQTRVSQLPGPVVDQIFAGLIFLLMPGWRAILQQIKVAVPAWNSFKSDFNMANAQAAPMVLKK
jgi:hypothetical protein